VLTEEKSVKDEMVVRHLKDLSKELCHFM